MKKLLAYIKRMPTSDLAGITSMLGLGILFCTLPIKNSNLDEKWINLLIPLLAALGFYLGGSVVGLVYIIRREAPVLPLGHALKGGAAVWIGVIMLLLGLSVGTLFLVSIWL